MNKVIFLQQLKQALQPLSQEDINEIIEDYTLLIEERILEGKTEADVIQSLGSPLEIAHMHKEELLEEVETVEELPMRKKRVGLFITMQILNILFVLWFFVVIGALIFATGAISISLLVTSPTLLVSWMDLSLLFKFSGMLLSIGLSLLLGCGVVIAVKYFSLIIKKYVVWNISLIK